MMPLCRHEGIGVIPWSPLARGLLARPRPADSRVGSGGTARSAVDAYSPRLYDAANDWDVVDAVEAAAKRLGISMAEVALAWLLGRPGVTAPIVGATKPEHLEAAIRAVDITLSEDERTALEASYRPHEVRGISP